MRLLQPEALQTEGEPALVILLVLVDRGQLQPG
jgi:hypothetical protein